MTIRHLKVFNEVCRYMNMTRASEKLHVSQPAISKTISELEDWYGIKLFERFNKTIYLTPGGKIVASYSRQIVDIIDKMDQEVKEKVHEDLIRVGVSITVRTNVFSDIVVKFKDVYKNVRVEVIVDNTRVIQEMILNNTLDIALIEGTVTSSDIVVEPFMQSDVILICSPKHPLYHKEKIELQDLENMDFIVREIESATRTEFENAMKKLGISWTPTWICHNTHAILNATNTGLGIGVVSEPSVRKKLKSGELRQIPLGDMHLQQSFLIIHHDKKYMSKTITAFKEYILKQFEDAMDSDEYY